MRKFLYFTYQYKQLLIREQYIPATKQLRRITYRDMVAQVEQSIKEDPWKEELLDRLVEVYFSLRNKE